MLSILLSSLLSIKLIDVPSPAAELLFVLFAEVFVFVVNVISTSPDFHTHRIVHGFVTPQILLTSVQFGNGGGWTSMQKRQCL